MLNEKQVKELLFCYTIRLGQLPVNTHRYRRTKLRGAIHSLEQVLEQKERETLSMVYQTLPKQIVTEKNKCATMSLFAS